MGDKRRVVSKKLKVIIFSDLYTNYKIKLASLSLDILCVRLT